MISRIAALDEANLHKLQQAVKWTVYALLIINFVFYIFEDWNRAIHTLDAESTFLDWTAEFATSIDESAWFLLLFMFELETYVLSDKDWKGWVAHSVRGVRVFCFLMIGHTIFAFTGTIIDYQPTVAVEGVSSLCEMTDDDVSYVYNLEYTTIDEGTCDSLSSETQFYWIAEDPVVATLEGLQLERYLAWSDLIEASVWVLIILAIEVVVRMQDHGVTGGTFLSAVNRVKLGLYAILILLGIYWAYLSHWLYSWDTLVWIAGFAAIEMNVSEWREELIEEKETS